MGRKDRSKCHQILGPWLTHSDMSMDSAPQENEQSFGALEGGGNTVTCSSWKFANVPGILEMYLVFLEEVTPLTL